jgi:cyanophycinase-like exopeptidase
VITRLEHAELVLIGGGSPTRLLALTRGTPALAALQSARRRGAVLAGCSAGAIALGAGLVEGAVTCRGWDWLSGRVVAPHFGRYDIAPWRAAFPASPIIGIPDGAMVVVTDRDGINSVGLPSMIVLPPLASG